VAHSSPPDRSGLSAFLDVLPVPVLTTDAALRVRRINPRAARLLGLAPDQALGKACDEVVRCSPCPEECALTETLRTGQTRRGIATEVGREDDRVRVRVDVVSLEPDELVWVLGPAEGAVPVPVPEGRVESALRRAAGNVTRAARLLGVHRTTLWRWMSEAGVRRERFFPE
jgi:transcriptional regulator with PAS, ATPase and Fis domain